MDYRIARLIIIGTLLTTPALSAEKMTGKELKALLADGQQITLGGPGTGYSGRLSLSADGKGTGEAKTDDGKIIKISGTWTVRKDNFCRTWKALNKGKEVCETWIKTGANSVDVISGNEKIGSNSW